MLARPLDEEIGGHFGTYIRQVPDGDVLAILEQQGVDAVSLFRSLPEEQGNYRYAPGKWSLKELILHMSDTERIMTGRLLRIARGDATPQPGFEQDDYVAASQADRLTLAYLIDDYAALRRSTLSLLRGIADEAWTHRGVASGVTMSARAFAYVVAGHERHHLNVIRDRYLGTESAY